VLLTHPITGRRILYANPGYTVRIDGWAEPDSDAMLADVLLWDDLCTLHNAQADYGPDELRLVKRCQVVADRVFDPEFARQAELAGAA
jgi:taurine dioxygenase